MNELNNIGLDEGNGDNSEDEDVKSNNDYVALSPFKDLYKQSPIVQMAFEFGPNCIPLSTIGMVFNFIGNHLLQYIHSTLKRKIFYSSHTVTGIQLLPNGEIITTAIRKDV